MGEQPDEGQLLSWEEMEVKVGRLVTILLASGWRFDAEHRQTQQYGSKIALLLSLEFSRGRGRGRRREPLDVDLEDDGEVAITLGESDEDGWSESDLLMPLEPLDELCSKLVGLGILGP